MLHRTWDDERGFSIVIVGLGLVAFLAATTLAIDVGMFMTARSQAQNAADAGALAGATALAFDNFDDRSAGGPAVQNAIQAATANQVMGAVVSVTPGDVTFLNDATGESNMIRVDVQRTGGRGNPVATLMGTFFGVRTVNIVATATAQAAPANAMPRSAPFMIPDRWIERQTGPWDVNDTFEMFKSNGDPLPNPDIYVPATDKANYTGYNPIRDKGTLLMIRAGTGNNIEPTMYFSWKEGDGTSIGADWYRDNIVTGNPTATVYGQPLVQEPGNMPGPTGQGLDALIAQDPGAYWDDVTNSVHSTMIPSPRVVSIPLYDPEYYATGKRNGRTADFKLANWLGFFIVSRSGNNVYGRITPIVGVVNPNAGPAPAGAFPRAIRLVQ